MYARYLFVAVVLVVANLAARQRPMRSRPVAAAPVLVPIPASMLVPITAPEWAGSSCNVDFMREIRRHPHWTLRIDAYEDRGCGLSPEVRYATLTITDAGATWQRDGRERYDGQPWSGAPMPQATCLPSDAYLLHSSYGFEEAVGLPPRDRR